MNRTILKSASMIRSLVPRLTIVALALAMIDIFVAQSHAQDLKTFGQRQDNSERVKRLLNERPVTQYLQKGDNELKPHKGRRKVSSRVNVFQKYKQRYEILGATVTVEMKEDGTVANVIDDRSTEQLVFGPALAQLDEEQAIEIVQDLHGGDVKATDSSGKLVWFRTRKSAVLAWHIETTLEEQRGVSPNYLLTTIDASTGKLLSQSQIDTSTYEPEAGKEAKVFPRIVINNNIGASGSQALGAEPAFNPIIALQFATSPFCSGVLISPDTVLTARHCNVFVGDSVIFGADTNQPLSVATVQSVSLPAGIGSFLDGGDVALLTLTADVAASVATPMRLSDRTSEWVGRAATIVGYGFNGIASLGHQGVADELRWAGENVIDGFGQTAGILVPSANIISTDFDDGSALNNVIAGSESTPLHFEATTAPGDSGSPILIQEGSEYFIAGVLSGGTAGNSQFGDLSFWTGIADFRSEIEAAGGQFFVPDPEGASIRRFGCELVINGTQSPDDIFVDETNGVISAELNQSLTGIYDANSICQLEINSFGGADFIDVDAGIATQISSGFGSDVVMGGSFTNVIFGGPGSDMIVGGPIDDLINAGRGTDFAIGRGGDDILIGGNANDMLLGGIGDDQLFGGLGADTIIGGPGDDLLIGNVGADRLEGGGGNDDMSGLGGPDELFAGAGNDTLRGGEGFDTLDGGGGFDTALDNAEVENSIEN